MTRKFNTVDIVIVALLAALGVAAKPIVQPFIKLITATLKIPSGTLAGIVYMFWPVLAVATTREVGAATLLSIVQVFIAYIIGFGSHGIASLPAYLLPGITIDFVFWVSGDNGNSYIVGAVGAALGNAMGVLVVNLVLFRMPAVALAISVLVGMLSGAVGGIAAIFVGREIRGYQP